MKYLPRLIDRHLLQWSKSENHKPLLLRGARQVGKSRSVRNLGNFFENFVEINFERNPEFQKIFKPNLDINRIVTEISILTNTRITEKSTLLFLDEIQLCPEAIMSLRFFKEDKPGLHVVAAGSLLEFALSELPTFGVGRIHSMFMYPMTFDEFLTANNESMLIEARNGANPSVPLSDVLHEKLVEYFRLYMLIGGMPEAVASWAENHDFLKCQEIQNDIIVGYEDDFAKYKKKVNTQLLRTVFRNVGVQVTEKFTYADIPGNYKTYEIKEALDLLKKAGLIYTVLRTDANGEPLGSEADSKYFKVLTLDPGLTLRLLNLSSEQPASLNSQIMTSTANELVNKGLLTELIAGLELLRYRSPDIQHELYYWTRQARNSIAEIDYVISSNGRIVPVEVKAGTRGGMKSLWAFMRIKKINLGVRSSLENFGTLEYKDSEDSDALREVIICPLYALSQLQGLLSETSKP